MLLLVARFLNELNSNQLTRAVNALVSSYDELDLANLSWAYWHACAATPHITPAHFGAAIEGIAACIHRDTSERRCDGFGAATGLEKTKSGYGVFD